MNRFSFGHFGFFAVAVPLLMLAPIGDAASYVHVAGPGESLAEIADEAYGDPAKEAVLAGQNALDSAGGASIVAGMRIEVPAPTYVRARPQDTWATLAKTYLGDPRRADWLARENHATAWVPPTPGQEIRVFAVLNYIGKEGDDMVAIARRYFSDAAWSWRLNGYNFREGTKVTPGEVLLIPLPELELVSAVREREKEDGSPKEATADDYRAQRRVEAELPGFLLDAARGRYLDVIVRGNRLLGRAQGADLSSVQLARIYEKLTEAYVAEGSLGQARIACGKWAAALGRPPELSVRETSPKIRAVCLGERTPVELPADAGAPPTAAPPPSARDAGR